MFMRNGVTRTGLDYGDMIVDALCRMKISGDETIKVPGHVKRAMLHDSFATRGAVAHDPTKPLSFYGLRLELLHDSPNKMLIVAADGEVKSVIEL